ncbi:MAG: VWA domain-containing protein [Gammaproteobacteria bacterium]|nr:VWA domain-containing protein [Gammaproteobacteria bacterium]
MLTLQWPWIFVLLPLPWLVFRFWPAARQEDAALLVPFYRQLPGAEIAEKTGTLKKFGTLAVLVLMWLALLCAAARPIWLGEPVSLPASGRDLLLAVDISGSMETADMQWRGEQFDRITIVKAVVGDFVERRSSDRLGLILFGTRAYLQAPLTFDRSTVKQLLLEAQLGFAGEKTAIGDAIGLAVKRLRQRPLESRVLILLTDGANTAGQITPLKAAELAAQAKIRVYTIGVGADEMTVPGLFGGFGARRINPSADLDETTLNSIAEQTGGRYFRARDPADLQAIYAELDKLEPIEQEAEVFRPTRALFYWPLGVCLALAGLLLLQRILTDLLLRLRALRVPAGDATIDGVKPDA